MNKGYKFLLKPTSAERATFGRWFGIGRFVYNTALAYSETEYALHKTSFNYNNCNDLINLIKYTEEFAWIREAPSQILQQKLLDLKDSFSRFFSKEAEFPQYKNKYKKQSLRLPQGCSIGTNYIQIPKIGMLKSITIKKENGQYCASVLVEKDRNWICSICHAQHDRDVNATINIKNKGLKELSQAQFYAPSAGNQAEVKACGGEEAFVYERSSLLKQETPPF